MQVQNKCMYEYLDVVDPRHVRGHEMLSGPRSGGRPAHFRARSRQLRLPSSTASWRFRIIPNPIPDLYPLYSRSKLCVYLFLPVLIAVFFLHQTTSSTTNIAVQCAFTQENVPRIRTTILIANRKCASSPSQSLARLNDDNLYNHVFFSQPIRP